MLVGSHAAVFGPIRRTRWTWWISFRFPPHQFYESKLKMESSITCRRSPDVRWRTTILKKEASTAYPNTRLKLGSVVTIPNNNITANYAFWRSLGSQLFHSRQNVGFAHHRQGYVVLPIKMVLILLMFELGKWFGSKGNRSSQSIDSWAMPLNPITEIISSPRISSPTWNINDIMGGQAI